MRKILLISVALVLLAGCAKTAKEVSFVPLQISWQFVDDMDSDTPYVSGCMVRMTNALMSDPQVQSHASENISYEAMVSGKSVGESLTLEFAGVCPPDSEADKSICRWTATCSAEGNIENLKWN